MLRRAPLHGLSTTALTSLLFLHCVGACRAQAVSDLALTINLEPDKARYVAGDVVRVDLTVTNSGPDPAAFPIIALNEFAFGDVPGGPYPVVIDRISQTLPCAYSALDVSPGPGGTGYIFISLTFPALAPGSSQTCALALYVLPNARGSYLVGGRIYAGGGSDPIGTNNEAGRRIRFESPQPRPRVVPSMNLAAATILMLALIIVGARAKGRTS
jgi:hypothetical protein